MKTKFTRENGQILVIFVVALVAMLGLTALAIDGGMMYADRRYDQSVADTAALAGAGTASKYLDDAVPTITYANFTCNNTRVVQSFSQAFNAALNRANANNILGLDGDLSDNHGIEVTCVNQPAQFDRHIDIHVKITSTVPTSFAHLFYKGPIKNTVDSVVRIRPRTRLGFGQAIVSTGDTCGTNTGGVVFDGTSDVFINGGGVFSNSCIEGTGNVDVNVTGGNIEYAGTVDLKGGASLSPAPQSSPASMPSQDITPPVCPAGAATAVHGGGTINPGNFTSIRLNNGTLNMNPGVYCVTGDVTMNGGTVNGTDVTFYLQGTGSSMTINGNVTANLSAPSATGMLIYMDPGNQGTVNLQGTGSSGFLGAVYVPDGTIEIGGTSGVNPTYNTQLIGKYIKVHGTARIDINFNAAPVTTEEPKMDQYH